MKIEINETINEQEKDFLIFLLNKNGYKVGAMSENINNTQDKTPLRFTEGGIKGEGLIYHVIKNSDGLTASEIAKKTGYSVYSVYGYVSILFNKKLLDKSATRPIIYYKRGNNVDLKEALKNFDKVVVNG